MVIHKICPVETGSEPLKLVDLPIPALQEKDILIKVSACGVCHTEIDEIEGRTSPSILPIVPGHQVIGYVTDLGRKATRFRIGDRVGAAWIFSACGRCSCCLAGQENLCPDFKGTGRDANGGYAEYMAIAEDFAFPIPPLFTDGQAAPLLCAGAVGYRSLKLTGMKDGFNLGLTGFGASGHIVLKTARHLYPHTKVFVFARNRSERLFAQELGAFWAGETEEVPPEPLDCIIDTTPVWKPMVEALGKLRPAGRLVINAIRKESIDMDYLLKLDYPSHLWLEKEIKSVANITRRDAVEFLELAAEVPILPEIQEFELSNANQALLELKERKIKGAKVLKI